MAGSAHEPAPPPDADGKRLQKSTSVTFHEAMADPDSEAYNSHHGRGTALGFVAYTSAVLLIAAVFSAVSVGFWSEMGCGHSCLDSLRSVQGYSSLCVAIGVGILLFLALFDVFSPPHLPGQYMTMWEGDRFVGRGLLGVAVASFVAAAFLIANKFPTVPLLVSIFLSPMCVLIFRWATTPQDLVVYTPSSHRSSENLDPAQSPVELQEEQFIQRMQRLRQLTGDAADQQCFYKAAAVAYTAVGAFCMVAFGIWIHVEDIHHEAFEAGQKGLEPIEKELRFIRFAAPVTVAISNFLFAGLMAVRVALHRPYAQTDEARNRLVVEAASRALGKEIMKYRVAALTEACTAAGEDPEAALTRMKSKIEEYLVQQSTSAQRLTSVIKFLNVALLVIVGAVVLAMQCALGDSPFATFTQGFVAAFAIIFGAFVVIAFARIRQQLSAWLRDVPLWKTAVSACTQSPARAIFFVVALPPLPILLALAAVNQSIRRCRGIDPPSTTRVGRIFGRRVEVILGNMQTWEWLSVITWSYVWCVVGVLMKSTPVFLNIFLAWMYEVMVTWNFGVVLGVTWIVGMLLFMLPPVPGPPIYLFGGLVITQKCPWGFWWGAAINVILSFFLKLTACSVQQKVIGGQLSNSLWVRKTCGVHTPLMRAIESALSKPGLSLRKVLILCGGPDWPTSVLAGILRVSVVQCLIGTIPIIFAVAPLGLSGSFYKAGGDEVWQRLSSFMFILSSVITMGFWAGCAWAVQEEFDKNQEALNAPREEFVDLEWLSYLSTKVSERCRVTWGDVPRCILALFIAGMLGSILSGSLFLWRMNQCLGTFAVDADIEELQWTGKGGILKPVGIMALGLLGISLLGLIVFKVWQAKFVRGPRAEALREIGLEEQEWKEKRRQQAREAQKQTLEKPTLEDLAGQQVSSLRRMLSAEKSSANIQGTVTGSTACSIGVVEESNKVVET